MPIAPGPGGIVTILDGESTEFLTYLFSNPTNPTNFTILINNARTAFVSAMAAADAAGRDGISQAVAKMNEYFVAHPVTYVAYSQDLLTLLSETKYAALTVAENHLSTSQVAYDSMVNNANIDYSRAVNRAYDIFNSSISNAYIKDKDFNAAYNEFAGTTYYAADGKLISIKSNVINKYWSMYPITADMLVPGEELKNAGYYIKANKDTITPSCRFVRTELKSTGDIGKFTLQTNNNQYISVVVSAGGDPVKQPAGRVIAKYNSLVPDAKFYITSNGIQTANPSSTSRFINTDASGNLRAINAIANTTTDVLVITALDFKSLMTILMDAASAQIESVSQASYDAFALDRRGVKASLDTAVTSFVTQRPIVRFNGVVTKPEGGIIFDQENAFSFSIQNIGELPWIGKMALKVKDQYNKSVEGNKVQVPQLSPNAITTVSLSVYVPKEDPVTLYNFGTDLTTYIKFYLITE